MDDLSLGALDFDHDIQPLITEALERYGAEPLTDDQIVVLKGSWLGLSYEQMAEKSVYSMGHLQRSVAPKLWDSLSDIFKVKVRKDTLQRVVSTITTNQPSLSDPNELSIKRKIIGTPPSSHELVHRPVEFRALAKALEAHRVVLLVGAEGIGKTSLVAQLFNQTEWLPTFQTLIWKYSICSDIDDDLNDFHRLNQVLKDVSLLDFIRSRRALICIDGIDNWLQDEGMKKKALTFIRRLAEAEHNSCVVLTAKEELPAVDLLQQSGRSAFVFNLKGLSREDSLALLKSYQLSGTKLDELIASTQGNPLRLHEAGRCISQLYKGDINAYIKSETSLAANILRKNLSSVPDRIQNLEPTEQQIFSFIASCSKDKPVLESDIISQVQRQYSFSISIIIKTIQKLKAKDLLNDNDDSTDPLISVPKLNRLCIQIYLKSSQAEVLQPLSA
jgi:hypothetical protein